MHCGARLTTRSCHSIATINSGCFARAALKTSEYQKKLDGIKKKNDSAKIAKLVKSYEEKYGRLKAKYIDDLYKCAAHARSLPSQRLRLRKAQQRSPSAALQARRSDAPAEAL